MGKERKQGAWLVFLRGGATALSLYLAGNLILAFVMVKGLLPEQAGFSVLTGLGFAAAAVGGVVAVRQSSWATLPTAMLNAVVIILILILIGVLIWPETFWNDRSIVSALSILVGGLIAGIWGARKRKGKRRPSRTTFK